MDGEPYSNPDAMRKIKAIASMGHLAFSNHALKEMAIDHICEVDAMNVLRAGWMDEPAEEKNGTWRYRVRTRKFVVVIAFRSDEVLAIVTAWRLGKS